MKYIYVVMFYGDPVASTDNFHNVKNIIEKFNGADKGLSTFIEYKIFDPKYPDDLQGSYFYLDNGETAEDEYKVYIVDYEKLEK